MPLYRRECAECGCEFRALELHGGDEGFACPACGGRNTQRLLPRVAVQFKGSGFYRTEYPKTRRGGGGESELPKESPSSTTPASAES